MSELEKANEVRKLLSQDSVKAQIAKALPSICTPDRFMRIAMTAITKVPKIANCTQESLMSCLLDCAQLGIEPDGRRAHLIPFDKKKKVNNQWVYDCTICQLIIDYKGLVDLVMRSGKISNIHADKVCENDDFVYDAGKVTKHVIDFRKDRGKTYAYYSQVEYKDGAKKAEVMNLADIESIRARSKSKDSGPWMTDYDEMAKKTVFRRLSKWLPLSPEEAQVLNDVESKEFDIDMPMARISEKKNTEPEKHKTDLFNEEK